MRKQEIKNVRIYAVVFHPGEDLNSELEKYLEEWGHGFAWFDGLEAQFHQVQIGFYDASRGGYDHEWLKLPDDVVPEADLYSKFEPAGVSGNVSWVDGKPFAHIHGSFASGFPAHKGVMLGGGHISQAIVGRTCELRLYVTDDQKAVRVMDPDPKCGVRVLTFEDPK